MSTATTKKNIPELRFPGFSGEWVEHRLNDFLVERNEKAPKSEEYPLMAFVANKGVASKGEKYNREFLVNDNKNKKYKRTEFGDFIYSSNNLESGSIGLNLYGSASISPVYSIFQIKEPHNFRFIGNLLVRKNFINKMIRFRQGVVYGQWKIRETDFLKIAERIPSFSEQQKIAVFLVTTDEILANLKAQKNKIEEYRQWIMQKMFSQEVRFKDDNGKGFPEWQTFKLGDLFTERTERAENNKHDLLSVTMNNGVRRYDTSVKKDGSSKNKSNYKVVRVGDIAYNTMRMWQGASGVSNYEGIVSPAYTVVTLKNGNSEFFGYLLKMPRVIFNFYRYSQGLVSDTWNLKFKHFSEVEVSVPTSADEQVKIKDFIKSIDDLIYFKSKQIEKAETWKKGLLQKMFV